MFRECFEFPLVLYEGQCWFRKCCFQGISTNTHFVYAKDSNLECVFDSCLFISISTPSNCHGVYIQDAVSGIIIKCCFYDNEVFHAYATGVYSGWCIPSSSVNATVCTLCRICAPFLGSYEEYTSYHNNHSYLTHSGSYSCYYLVRNPVSNGDINCFFIGSACDGPYPVQITPDITGVVISKFVFVNNTDNSGYFWIYHSGVTTLMTQSVIAFSSPPNSLRWIYAADAGAFLRIENSDIIAFGSIPDVSSIILSNINHPDSFSTIRRFWNRPNYRECNYASNAFTYSPTLALLAVFFPLFLFLLISSNDF